MGHSSLPKPLSFPDEKSYETNLFKVLNSEIHAEKFQSVAGLYTCVYFLS